jgi:hypothetical protein
MAKFGFEAGGAKGSGFAGALEVFTAAGLGGDVGGRDHGGVDGPPGYSNALAQSLRGRIGKCWLSGLRGPAQPLRTSGR